MVYTMVSTSRFYMVDDDLDEIDKLCNLVSNSDDGISSDESKEQECYIELNPVWCNMTTRLKGISSTEMQNKIHLHW